MTALAFAALGAVPAAPLASTAEPETAPALAEPMTPSQPANVAWVTFDVGQLEALGWRVTPRGHLDDLSTDARIALAVDPSSFRSDAPRDDLIPDLTGGQIRLDGTFLLTRKARSRYAMGRFLIAPDASGRWTLRSRLGAPDHDLPVLDITDFLIDAAAGEGTVRLVGDLSVASSLADALDEPAAAGVVIATIEMMLDTTPPELLEIRDAAGADRPGEPDSGAARTSNLGPDVIVGRVHDVFSYGGSSASPGISAFSVGTISCNKGDQPIPWYANTNQHPVIAQNLYRLKQDRLEQIGLSWVKHGFAAVQGNTCQFGCTPPPGGSNQLGVGCSDPYSAGLNGSRDNMGPRSDVNPHTGVFPYPWSAPEPTETISRRVQVRNQDLDPALNAGALYFAEGHYVTPDDAAAGNQNNNAAYRPVEVTQESFNFYSIDLTGFTRSEWPALYAWGEHVPGVLRRNIQIPDDGLVIVASKATDLANGFWHYEYAIQNLNADRGAASFSVPIEPSAVLENIGFHDVDYHSGEPYDGTNWTATVANGAITWATTPYAVDPNANALRWGTLYNFRFDADVPPLDVTVTIGLFKPGSPSSVGATLVGPVLPPPQCGDGAVDPPEACDPPDNVLCDGNCQFIANDGLRGGLLWDRWWATAEVLEPTGDHPLYPPVGTQSGSDTFRCAECHGWDYKGADGAYASGPHFTGIPGVFSTTKTPLELFLLIKQTNVPNGHGLVNYGVSDQDVRDLVQFMIEYVVDTDTYIDGSGTFVGAAAAGQVLYETGGSITCKACHGTDGTMLNYGTFETPEWVGTTAAEDPWRLLHKIRFGNAGGPMPSWLASGGTDQSAADIGRHAQVNLPAVCTVDAQCDDGAFCNGAEACVAAGCVRGTPPCPDQPCDEMTDACGVADAIRGGLLYDRWWAVRGLAAPDGEHPLYPPEGQQTGSSTHRCKECHGWDYKGADGAYGSGAHYTGIRGVFGSILTAGETFDLILTDTPPNGHDYDGFGMTEQDAWDLVEFLGSLVIDTDLYIDASSQFLGDPVQGEQEYKTGGSVPCLACHGADGAAINFGTPQEPEWVGTIAVNNPWELLHKIRVGQPGSGMPSWLAAGESDQSAADIGRYAQLNFPVECRVDPDCADDAFCNGTETCPDGFCAAGSDPCPGAICDEDLDSCLSGLCDPPWVEAAGSRYLAITPQPVDGGAPVRLRVRSPAWPCLDKFVGGVSRCAGVGETCSSDADCNRCSLFASPCLTDDDCVVAQGETCVVSGEMCLPGVVEPIDINGDGFPDGMLGELVDDPADALALTPGAWGTSQHRCSKSYGVCAVDDDCDHGVCIHDYCGERVCDTPCSTSAQDCLRFCNDYFSHGCQSDADCSPGVECVAPTCQRDEVCRRGRVYVSGAEIAPTSKGFVGQSIVVEPSIYEVRADCGTVAAPDLSLPATTTTWLWSDVDDSGYCNFADIQFMVLGFQGVFSVGNMVPSTLLGGDIVGSTPCVPDHTVNFTDIQAAVFAFQDESYADRLDTGLCAGDARPCSVAAQDCLDDSTCVAQHGCTLPCGP